MEADVFVPGIKLAIEYDGPHHRTRRKKDEEQNYVLNQLGIRVLRVRVSELPEVHPFKGTVFIHDTNDEYGLTRCLRAIGQYIANEFPVTKDQIKAIEAWDRE